MFRKEIGEGAKDIDALSYVVKRSIEMFLNSGVIEERLKAIKKVGLMQEGLHA